MSRMTLVQRHADHHGTTRPLSSLTAIVLHETEGFNGGDYATLKAGGPHNVSVHFWVPDYDDGGTAAQWLTPDGGMVVQFLALDVTGASVGRATPGFGNTRTVSIELGNYNSEAYGALQLEMLDQLIAHIDQQLGRKLPILSHAEVALPRGRKTDPGRSFPLAAYKAYRRHNAPAPVTPPAPPGPVPTPMQAAAAYEYVWFRGTLMRSDKVLAKARALGMLTAHKGLLTRIGIAHGNRVQARALVMFAEATGFRPGGSIWSEPTREAASKTALASRIAGLK